MVVSMVVVLAVIVDTAVVVDWLEMLNRPIVGSAGAANVTVHAATFTVNGVISCHVPFLRMNGVIADGGVLQR